MRKALPALFMFALVILCVLSVPYLFQPVKKKFRPMSKYDGIEQAFEQEYMKTKHPKTGEVPREKLREAAELRDRKLQRLGHLRAVAGISWKERGPSNIGGRTRALLYDAADAANGYKKVWAGGVSGGLWYTNDITAVSPVWQHIDDFFENIAISSLAQDPSDVNVMYFGTGEGWGNFDAARGLGIWKSINGGRSWNRLTATNGSAFHWIQKLAVLNNGDLLAATKSGLYISNDGGASFNKILGTGTGGASLNDIADIEVGANGFIYVSIGISGSRDGIYKSEDGGSSWTRIYTSLSGEARIDLACAPSNANYLYAAVGGNGGQYRKTIRSVNAATAGPSFTTLSMPSWCDAGFATADPGRGQAWYDLIGAVSPDDPETYFLGLIDVFKTADGGASWSQITQWANNCPSGVYLHADVHAFTHHPANPDQVLIGCDGGIFITPDNGTSFYAKNSGFNITQFYSAATHPSDPDYFLAGAQDNGTQKFKVAGMNATSEASGGDGAFCFIDQDDPNVQITSYVRNNYYVSTNGGTTFSSFPLNNGGQFINCADYDDAENILYSGNATGSFLRWNNVATGNPTPDTTWARVSGFGTSALTFVGVSPITSNRVYFGLQNGTVLYVDDAHTGEAYAGTVLKTSNGSPVSCIAIDPANEDHILVTHSSYGVTSVFESENALSGAPTWTSVEGDLPDMPVRWAMFDPRNSDWALLATELGVWTTDNLNGTSTEWNPTNTGLANVRVDMLQYSPGTRVLAAATHGRGLFTAMLPGGSGGPEINFQSANAEIIETAAVDTGCTTYKDHLVSISINEAPVGDATVTLSVDAASTASRHLDFDITTNGDFTSPVETITFLSGETSSKNFLLRIYDDQTVEGMEEIIFNLTVSGTTNASEGATNTFTVTINDNDEEPGPGNSADYLTGIPVGNAGFVGPFYGANTRGKFQYVVYADELTNAGVKAGPLNALGIYVASKITTGVFEDFTLRIGHTHLGSMKYGFLSNALTTVFSADYNTVVGMNTFHFNAPFTWNGSDDIVVECCYSVAAAMGSDPVLLQERPGGDGNIPVAYSLRNSGSACGFNAEFLSYYRPMFEFTQTIGETPVASAVSTFATETLGPYADSYFYAPDGSLLARIKNLGNHDYGCTELRIDRAGTGGTQFWNNNVPEYLTDKTFLITPTFNNPAGEVEVTIYYSAAEKQGWELATGQDWNNIQLVKSPGAVSEVTPSNPYPDGPGSIQIVVPARSLLGSHYALSHTFSNGFSGFAAGIPGESLPVTITRFQGMNKNGFNILEWGTSSEQNNKGFIVQRSYDNNTFNDIGFVPGAANSRNALSYAFRDPEPAAPVAYYRLRQEDVDGRSQYSQTILLKSTPAGGVVSLLRNPVANSIGLKIDRRFPHPVNIRLVDMSGRIIDTWQYTALEPQSLWLPQKRALPKGIYTLYIHSQNERYTIKLLKE